jgi:prepilin-type N-terminal cleavage/methylation domain-containing protein
MRILETNARHRRHRESGFSLLEMVAVMAISLVLTVVSVLSLIPVVKQQHVVNGYNTTLSAMRQARDNAISQRTSYAVTFANASVPNTITVAPGVVGFQGDLNSVTYQLPVDVLFLAQQPGIGSTPPPDGFGMGANAIDFGYTTNGGAGGAATIYFCPDGSAQVAVTCLGAGNWDNGVVYIAQSGNMLSSRAVDVWGGTGRIRGWRLYPLTSGGYQWLRQ